jgi:hypothetical protein
MTIDIQGAQGGTMNEVYSPAAGGLGGRMTASLTVASGTTLYIYVGGKPTTGSSSGGWNGGGTPGNSTAGAAPGIGGYAGGGGGASDIRIGTTLATRIAVAGGGGGAGRDYVNTSGCAPCGTGGAGGAGGSTTGATGSNAANWATVGLGGSGGTQSAGGAGGVSTKVGGSGSLGQGGTGTSGSQDTAAGGGGGGYYGGGGGGQPSDGNGGGGGGGGGGSSYADGTYVTSVSHAQGYRTGNGVVSITYDNAPVPTTFSTTESSPTNIATSGTISYSLVLSQSVSDLAVGDFQFGGTSTCNSPGLSGSGTTYTVTVTNCTEGNLILQLKANSVTGTYTGPPSVSSANTVIIDRTAPTISSVNAPTSKTYIPSDTATFTVNFSESVTVTGTPRLTLTVGSSTEYATYLSMSDSKTALFRYTVATDPAEFDTDGIAVATSLDLNSGTIRDLATNALTLTFSAPTLTGVLVAQPAAAPTIDSITATNATLTVYFTAGAARGSTTSTYQYSANNGAWTTRASGTTASPLAISGLTNGTGYTIRIRAVTNAGNSDSSTAVTETPTAVSVTGDATLVITYGNSGTTGNYSATGGTGIYTWSLGSSISGVTLSSTAVTASNTLTAGTYSQSVRATDGNSQVGTKTLTITVNKASTSVSIALPNSATSAALGGAVTITATVPRAGAVNFKLGGSTISGCGSSAAASTSATCSWTPGSLGSVSLTAVFTPTDSGNYETSTTTTLTITVVNGVSSVSLSLTGGVTQVSKSQPINIIAAVDQAGKITFLVDGKRISGCTNKSASVGNVTCTWRPATQKTVTITANLNPSNNVYNSSTSSLRVEVVRRTGRR